MIENKNHLNTKSNNDNKDKVPRKWHFGCRACMCCHLSTLTLCDPMNFSPPGSSAHGRTPPPCPPPGDLHNPGIKPMSLKSPALAGRFFTTSATRKQQLELNLEQQTDSKSGKENIKVVYCHLAYLTYMQSTSSDNARLDEAQAGIRIAGRNINNLRYADDTTLMAESKELKSLLMKVKEESEKVGFKFNIQ